jgi:hypothetical protein
MHPLAVPVVVVWLLVASSTIHASWAVGTPISFYTGRFGRGALGAMAAVYAATLILWILRWFGLFGGPVPVW